MAVIRQKDDFKNWAVGGAVSGSLFGLTSKYMAHETFSANFLVGVENVNLGNQQQIFEAITAKCKDFSVNNWCVCASMCIVL